MLSQWLRVHLAGWMLSHWPRGHLAGWMLRHWPRGHLAGWRLSHWPCGHLAGWIWAPLVVGSVLVLRTCHVLPAGLSCLYRGEADAGHCHWVLHWSDWEKHVLSCQPDLEGVGGSYQQWQICFPHFQFLFCFLHTFSCYHHLCNFDCHHAICEHLYYGYQFLGGDSWIDLELVIGECHLYPWTSCVVSYGFCWTCWLHWKLNVAHFHFHCCRCHMDQLHLA